MISVIKKMFLLNVLLSAVVYAQTQPIPRLQVVKTSDSTMYMQGNKPSIKITPKGVMFYAYDKGRPVAVVHSNGSYVQLEYQNSALHAIQYSSGSIVKSSRFIPRSFGSTIPARGSYSSMGNWNGIFVIDDNFEGTLADFLSDRGFNWDIKDEFPGGLPKTMPDRIKCLYDNAVALMVALKEFCPFMLNEAVCIRQAVGYSLDIANACMAEDVK